jgi:hypothetical protein
VDWGSLSCGSKITRESLTINEIQVNYHQGFLASTHSNFFQGQTDRGLLYWSNHCGETRLFKQEDGCPWLAFLSKVNFANVNE